MATTSTAIVPFDPVFADPKRLAVGGFLAGYSGLTRDAYELDLRQYVAWCDDHPTAMSYALYAQGVAQTGSGEPVAAVEHFHRSADLAKKTKNQLLRAMVEMGLAAAV